MIALTFSELLQDLGITKYTAVAAEVWRLWQQRHAEPGAAADGGRG